MLSGKHTPAPRVTVSLRVKQQEEQRMSKGLCLRHGGAVGSTVASVRHVALMMSWRLVRQPPHRYDPSPETNEAIQL